MAELHNVPGLDLVEPRHEPATDTDDLTDDEDETFSIADRNICTLLAQEAPPRSLAA